MDTKRLLLIGGLGVVAIVGFLQLQKLTTPQPAQQTRTPVVQKVSTVEYVDILIARVDIPLGGRLNPEIISWKKWPAEALSESMIDNVSHPQAMEKYTKAVTRTPIYAGEPILSRKVVHSGERGQMSALLRPGMRAISTRINVESAAGGFIQPGDRVDVVLTSKATIGGAVGRNYVSSTIFENVKVLAIGQTYGNTEDGTAYITGSTALLELSQDDSEVLIEAQSSGDLSLTLRGLENRRPAFVPSAATSEREKTGDITSLTVYRNGAPQQVAIQGQ